MNDLYELGRAIVLTIFVIVLIVFISIAGVNIAMFVADLFGMLWIFDK